MLKSSSETSFESVGHPVAGVSLSTSGYNASITQILCHQCGIIALPHAKCRCLMCGVRHAHVPGCHPVECLQCGLRTKPHRVCLCRRCGRKHAHSTSCRQHREVQMPDAMNVHGLENTAPVAHHVENLQRRASRLRAAVNGSIPDVQTVGDMDHVCPHCLSRSLRGESINCCAHGGIVLPSFPDVPEEFSNLVLSAHVRSNIRKYNMAMAMASVGHQNISLPDGMFTLGGKTFHRVGSLLPVETMPHAFAQIYMLDMDEASERRVQVQGSRDTLNPLRPTVLAQLHSWLLQNNPWVRQFVNAARSNLPRLVWRSTDDMATMQIGALVVNSGSKRDIIIERQVRVPNFSVRDISTKVFAGSIAALD
jgi:hypothetical protein